MADGLDERVSALEEALRAVERRLASLEAPPPAQAPPPAASPPPAAPPARPPDAPPAERPSLEDLLGGRVLAWVGGVAVVLGVVFFVVMAVRRGWIDEPTRVLLAFAGSTLLLAAGLYLYERRGQTEAAVATVAAALASLYASLTAATRVYELVSPELGLLVAALVGAAGAAIAVRWQAAVVGWLGILGALASPMLVDADTSTASLAFMAVALVSATAVLVWQRWSWLAGGAFLLSVPQLGAWLFEGDEPLAVQLVVLALFWANFVAAAVGFELRVPTATLRASSALLLLANALAAGGFGYDLLHEEPGVWRESAWVLGLALGHMAVGLAGFRRRVSPEVAALLVAIGMGLAAIALALALDGPALVAGWSAEAALLAWVAKRTGDRRAYLGTAGLLAAAALHVLSEEAPVQSLFDGLDGLATAVVAVLAVGAASALAAALYEGEPLEARAVFAGVAAAAFIYAPSVAIVDLLTPQPGVVDQTAQVSLSAFWAVLGLAAVVAGLVRDLRPVRLGGLALLGAAVVKVFAYDLSELEDIFRVLSFVALGLLLLAGAYAYGRVRGRG